MTKILFKNGNVFYHGKLQKLDVLIENETIIEIKENISQADKVIDLEGKLLTPGFVDIHVHLREPGFEYKETIASGTNSAKYGGYTHLVAMANTIPCMDNIETIKDFEKRVKKDAKVHTYTYSAITKGLKGEELVDFNINSKENIVAGFSDDGKGVQSKDMMEMAMKAAKSNGSIIVAHCEDEAELEPGACINDGNYAKDHGLVGINNASEYNHVIRDLKLAKEIGNRYHICHISTKETVWALRDARKTNSVVSGEACPHHLILTDDNIKDMNSNYKMNPPLRSKEDLNALIEGINDGSVTVISTDHAPHATEEKNKPIDKAPFGIIGNQHAFSLMYTYIVKKGLIPLEKVLTCMSINPAKIIGIEHDLEVGLKANFVVFDLEEEYVITKESIKSKSINTPFIGTKCFGALKYHVLDGKVTEI